jgi:hypothetical protein
VSELVLDEAKGERPDPEVAAVAKRRRFTAEYKLRHSLHRFRACPLLDRFAIPDG